MHHIKKLSRFLKYGFYVGAILHILFHFLYFTTSTLIKLAYLNFPNIHHALPVSLEKYLSFSWGHKLLIAFSCLPSNILYSLALFSVAKLLALYEKGIYFSEEAAKRFGNIGKFFILSVIVSIPQEALFTAAVTLHEPAGHRFLRLSFSNHDFTAILFALMIILVGWVMKEASRLKHDQDLTV